MMFCAHCGGRIEQVAGFCPHCGGNINQDFSPPPSHMQQPSSPVYSYPPQQGYYPPPTGRRGTFCFDNNEFLQARARGASISFFLDLVFLGLILYFRDRYQGMSFYEKYEYRELYDISSWVMYVCIFSAVFGLVGYLQASGNTRSQFERIEIREDGIYGMVQNREFDVPYAYLREVHFIKAFLKRELIIETQRGEIYRYRFFQKHAKEVHEIIKRNMGY